MKITASAAILQQLLLIHFNTFAITTATSTLTNSTTITNFYKWETMKLSYIKVTEHGVERSDNFSRYNHALLSYFTLLLLLPIHILLNLLLLHSTTITTISLIDTNATTSENITVNSKTGCKTTTTSIVTITKSVAYSNLRTADTLSSPWQQQRRLEVLILLLLYHSYYYSCIYHYFFRPRTVQINPAKPSPIKPLLLIT